MPATTLDRLNYLNAALMVTSCILAYLFPFSLLLFSYAILGPAHYLTQISWLHDRHYFSTHPYTPALLFTLTLALLFFPGPARDYLWVLTLGVALALLLPLNKIQFMGVIALSVAAAYLFKHTPAMLFLAFLLPTVMHVFVFTVLFVLAGTLKEKSRSGLWSLVIMLACAASFFVAPETVYQSAPMLDHVGIRFFIGIADYLNNVLNIPITAVSTTRLFAFLSFAYTYHYLNWFTKTRIIQWHKISRKRLYLIIFIYVAAIGLYILNYELGFQVLLFLSVLHVVLEFPLNWKTLGMIAILLRKNLGRQKKIV